MKTKQFEDIPNKKLMSNVFELFLNANVAKNIARLINIEAEVIKINSLRFILLDQIKIIILKLYE